MHCSASKCKQTCAAHNCSTTKSGLVSSLTEQKCNSGKSPCCQHIMIQNSIGVLNRICVRKKRCTCSKYSLNTNYITLRTSNVFEVVKTQPSTTQGDVNFQAVNVVPLKDQQITNQCLRIPVWKEDILIVHFQIVSILLELSSVSLNFI